MLPPRCSLVKLHTTVIPVAPVDRPASAGDRVPDASSITGDTSVGLPGLVLTRNHGQAGHHDAGDGFRRSMTLSATANVTSWVPEPRPSGSHVHLRVSTQPGGSGSRR